MYTYYILNDASSLSHHGIRGQKWGVRRYQNADGSLTNEGRTRYGSDFGQAIRAKRVLSSGSKVIRAGKKYDKAKNDLTVAKKNESAAAEKYLNAKNAYNKTTRKLDNAQNGLTARVIGANGRKVRKLQAKAEKQSRKLSDATTYYDKTKDRSLSAQLIADKRHEKYTKAQKKYDKRVQRYIDRYGEEAFSAL